MNPPAHPKIYHITHWAKPGQDHCRGLSLVRCGDHRTGRPTPPNRDPGDQETTAGRTGRRLPPRDKSGQYVPFYFCPRSVMLYHLQGEQYRSQLHRRPTAHSSLRGRPQRSRGLGGGKNRRWAFTDRNAGSGYFQSFRDLARLGQLNWDHIATTDFRDKTVQDTKQAEFLIHESFPWPLVRSIGVIDDKIADASTRDRGRLQDHRPDVEVQNEWYY